MKLEESIKNIGKPELSNSAKERLKGRILSEIGLSDVKSFTWLEKFKMEVSEKVQVKERVFAFAEYNSQKKFFIYRVFAFHKKVLSSVLSFAIIFMSLSFVGVDTSIVRASDFTRIESIDGMVNIKRGTETMPVMEGMQLFENDVVITGRDGSAVIRYFDDSVSRLSKNTKVEINELSTFDESQISSYVEITVINGVVWSKVLSLVEENSSFVVVAKDVYAKAKKATFNVDLEFNDLELEVYGNNVEIHRPAEKSGKIANVMSGQKLVSESGKNIEIQKIDVQKNDTTWVANNLKEDINYIVLVEEEHVEKKKDIIAVSEVTDYKFENNTLREDATLLLTFDDVKAKKIKLDFAEEDFIAAELSLRDETLSEEQKAVMYLVVDNFAKAIEDYKLIIDEVALRDEVYSAKLKKDLKDRLYAYKKDFSTILPDSALYVLKEKVDGLEEMIAEKDSDIASLKVDKALNNLGEYEELVDKGESDLADISLGKFEENLAVAKEAVSDVAVSDTTILDFDLVNDSQINSKEVLVQKIEDAELIRKNIEDKNIAIELEKKVIDYSSIEKTDYGVEVLGDKPVSPLLNILGSDVN